MKITSLIEHYELELRESNRREARYKVELESYKTDEVRQEVGKMINEERTKGELYRKFIADLKAAQISESYNKRP